MARSPFAVQVVSADVELNNHVGCGGGGGGVTVTGLLASMSETSASVSESAGEDTGSPSLERR